MRGYCCWHAVPGTRPSLGGPDNRAHADLRALLNLAGYRALTGHTVRQSIGLLSAASVVICEEILPDGTLKDLPAALDRVYSPPALVVTSATVEPRLWAEVLNLGGCRYSGLAVLERGGLVDRAAHPPDR